ncbi:hypothetical protein DHEL01_v205130 [Diaporthe helianthi]|uniref:Uncharacterized protein n=1 Tax=Diaporthe helianthi TaxID=158607 RepID=A0A2P5I1X4_DIAHE|nr:hypothetical protein DHEL01_v205130 [Diaporthe helianthi]
MWLPDTSYRAPGAADPSGIITWLAVAPGDSPKTGEVRDAGSCCACCGSGNLSHEQVVTQRLMPCAVAE